MDALALLCNLHADGPTTLARLRGAGIQTLGELQDLAPDELGRLLEADGPWVHRFRSECQRLGSRLGEADRSAADGPTPGDRAHLLATWREADRRSPPAPPTAPPPAASPAGVLIPRPPARQPARAAEPLAPRLLDGLDRATCERLRARVATLGELVDALPLELARGAGLGYTRVLRLQFLARRAIEEA